MLPEQSSGAGLSSLVIPVLALSTSLFDTLDLALKFGQVLLVAGSVVFVCFRIRKIHKELNDTRFRNRTDFSSPD